MKIRTHDYAKQAYLLVESIKDSEIEAKYRTLALNFPIMIMQSGLAQAIGFLMAKNKAEHQKLLLHVANLLNKKDDKVLHDEILSSDITQYQLLTRKALDASGWLKRYTEALLGKENQAVNN